ncbi:MT-A70-domain-containing protein [Aspergillus japonicus CBS 114.51]|uniref:MT-A70-domain-containing protein n=1 Tax=Aspergillus japonicus CBS 114.51 TaxID=1448312 RepID=A0A8T8X9Q6_ASPJA|nr:MT-A70-domain-containing protein [Aspergillus japonicus CBS 114.51]RAH84730.1 MT-A70-domain-containing protein [Aspergillus japonicus CBS 114.51]
MIAPSPSAILYQDPQATTFLIDIPSSIARAQSLSPFQSSALLPSARSPSVLENDRNRRLLSTPPLRVPYPTRTEPKTDAARARVLERTPLAERLLHSEILEPLVTKGLFQIRSALDSGFQWCLPRVEIDPSAQDSPRNGDIGDGAPLPKKRKGTAGRTRCSSHGNVDAAMEPIASASAAFTAPCASLNPPLILSPGVNRFSCMSELSSIVVRNTSLASATVHATCTGDQEKAADDTRCCHSGPHPLSPRPVPHSFYIPPLSSFLQDRIPISSTPVTHAETPIPGLPRHRKFNLILLDPPWANRSVRRSGHYHTQTYLDWELLTQRIRNVLSVHLVQESSSFNKEVETAEQRSDSRRRSAIAAIWITNSSKARKTAYDAMQGAGLTVCEEWVWVKTTTEGEPITPVGALWRKPYEILVIGKKGSFASRDDDGHPAAKAGEDGITRRVIAAVPDVHSRKPNLREVFEQVFFYDSSPRDNAEMRYTALEVFARNLTAGWWAVGDEALKFNAEEWWVEG